MEEEDDDFYAPNGGATAATSAEAQTSNSFSSNAQAAVKEEKGDEGLEEGEEEEEDDSESDIDIITERKDEPVALPSRFPAVKPEPTRTTSGTPLDRSTSQQPAAAPHSKAIPIIAPKPGSSYPEVRTSTVDVNANPIWEQTGKPVTQLDIDADLAEHAKPWRLPGSDQSDYFNYGFDEFTWTSYCLRQNNMAQNLSQQKNESAQFQQMFGGAMPGIPGAGAMPSMPSAAGMPSIPGMPGQDDMMATMTQYMMANGITDPSQIDFNAFMAQMQGGGAAQAGQGQAQQAGMAGVPSGPAAQQQQQQQQQQGQYGGGGQQGNYGYGAQQGGGNFGGKGRGRRW
ncbi:hypothetical protein M501DRAFT_1004794 [Patellaria atrata CBS 101060]|uniref:Pre-mRNA polyadenylation factor Fip1 domain-containing protein n=1 Tax=Patellaria atrata CBS 101060 TaxID=1346257 RepID=A0A9P4SA76_9PEZI|nr:hypothetical protein M501DRAFT_1004794 [Patellaria atrata CBS 101060]